MAYVEWHDTVRNHFKTDALMFTLKVKRREAVGILGCLSSWAVQYRPGGVIERNLVAVAVEWEEKPEVLVAALVKAGWLDEVDAETVKIHDWKDITRGFRKARKDAARRKRGKRATDARQDGGKSAAATPNRTEQNRTERAEQSGASGTEAAPPARQPTKPGTCPEARLVSHWNDQPGRAVISPDKGVRHIQTAAAAGVPLQAVEAAFWDQARCAGKKLYEVTDELTAAHRTNGSQKGGDLGYVIDRPAR